MSSTEAFRRRAEELAAGESTEDVRRNWGDTTRRLYEDRVLQAKRTFWQDHEELEQDDLSSLIDVEVVVASPILSGEGEVIGAIYGDCRQNSLRGAPKVTKVEPIGVCDEQQDVDLVVTGSGFLQLGMALPRVTFTAKMAVGPPCGESVWGSATGSPATPRAGVGNDPFGLWNGDRERGTLAGRSRTPA